MKSANSFVYFLILLILSLGAVKPLITAGFFPMHDDTQPTRVYLLSQALKDGQFPVRWVSDLGYGYGYPLFNFYAPLPYYIGAIFNLIGFDAINATKIMFAIGVLLASFSMYFLVSEIAGNQAGVASALLYQYAPYHAVNIYIRGAVGEYYAYGFLPILLLGIIKIIKEQKNLGNGLIIGSLGLAGILLSHNILGMITLLFFGVGLFLFLIINFGVQLFSNSPFTPPLRLRGGRGELRLGLGGVIIFVIGLGLSAFFTLPAFAEKGYARVIELTAGGSDFRNHFVYPDQLWDSSWGYAGSAPGRIDGMSFKIGKVHIFFGLFGSITFLWFRQRKKFKPDLLHLPRRQADCYIVSLLIFSVSLFFLLEPSRFLWELIPGFSYIQYPWRFLNFTVFSLSILTSALFLLLKKLHKIILAAVIIILTIWFNLKYFVPKEYVQAKAEDYISDLNLRFKISKISDEYLTPEFKVPTNEKEIAWRGLESSNDINIIETIIDTPTLKKYKIFVQRPTRILTNIAYFPGWMVFLNKKSTNIENEQGRIIFDVPNGQHLVTFRLVNTPVRTTGNALSFLSLILLVYVTWQKRIRLIS